MAGKAPLRRSYQLVAETAAAAADVVAKAAAAEAAVREAEQGAAAAVANREREAKEAQDGAEAEARERELADKVAQLEAAQGLEKGMGDVPTLPEPNQVGQPQAHRGLQGQSARGRRERKSKSERQSRQRDCSKEGRRVGIECDAPAGSAGSPTDHVPEWNGTLWIRQEGDGRSVVERQGRD